MYPALGGDCPRNFVLASTQALDANVTGITGALSGQWIQEARPEFDIEQLAKFFNHLFLFTSNKHKGNYAVSYHMGNKENSQSCDHLEQSNQNTQARTPNGCEECLQIGSPWVHLRLCLSCGHVGCCDQSINKHGTKHFHSTRHPVIRSYEPGESWKWCFVDEVFTE
jgi:hypothetical protein